MSMNQYRGREETDKKDFGKKSVEKQKKLSEENINEEEQDEIPVNENIAQEAKRKAEREQARKTQ